MALNRSLHQRQMDLKNRRSGKTCNAPTSQKNSICPGDFPYRRPRAVLSFIFSAFHLLTRIQGGNYSNLLWEARQVWKRPPFLPPGELEQATPAAPSTEDLFRPPPQLSEVPEEGNHSFCERNRKQKKGKHPENLQRKDLMKDNKLNRAQDIPKISETKEG